MKGSSVSVKDRSVVDPLNKFDPYHMYASSMEPSKPSILTAVVVHEVVETTFVVIALLVAHCLL